MTLAHGSQTKKAASESSSHLTNLDDSAALTRAEKEQAFLLATERFRRSEPTLLSWSEAFRVERGKPLDFENYPFQIDVYRDFGDRSLGTVDIMKSGQCGISAAAVSLTLYAGDIWGANVLYVLPGALDAYDFSDGRVKPAIDDSPYLSNRVAGSLANKGLRQMGRAYLYFRGSVSDKKALSIPADVLILDEYDHLEQRNIPAFQRRLGAPTSLKLERRFSNPTFPEAGIHGLYLQTDQREWLVRCPSCRTEAPLNYEPGGEDDAHHIDEERALRVCRKCRKPLKPETIGSGRWVPRRRRTEHRGYHISKLIVPSQDVAELVAKHAKTVEDELQAHFNFDLGLPYSPKGGSLSQDTVMACRRDYTCPDSYAGSQWVTAGVDVGKRLHVRISRWLSDGRAAALYVGEAADFEELALLWDRYGVNFGLVDEKPEERLARSFAQRFPGRCMLTHWAGEDQRDNLTIDTDRGLVIPRRSWACDKTVAAFSSQTRLLPRTLPRDYISQVTAPHRIVELRNNGQKIARYRNERADHYFFAETYDLMAREARGGAPAEASGPPPERIRPRLGLRR